ncbi:hypothetical protein ACI78Q_22380 [Geodermatophilus sp. SYSU D00705]
MPARRLAGAALRRLAPRTFHALEEVPVLTELVRGLRDDLDVLRTQVRELGERSDGIRADLEQARTRGGVADDAIARLFGRVDGIDATVAEVQTGLAESRRLSLRVAQMTDLVFDRLGGSNPDGTRS